MDAGNTAARGQLRRQLHALCRQNRELEVKNRIASAFLTSSGHESYCNALDIVCQALGSEFGVFGCIDEAGNLVCPSMTRHIWERCQVPEKSIIFPPDTWGGIWGRTLAEGTAEVSNGPFHVPPGHVPVVRAISVPLMQQGHAIGLLAVANKPRDHTPADLTLLRQIAESMGPVLSARLEAEKRDTERQRAEAALRESEARWRSLVESAPDFILVTDPDGNIRFVNRTSFLSRAELIGTHARQWVAPENALRLEEACQRALASAEPADYETEVCWPERGSRWYHCRIARLVVSGEVAGFVILVRDITQRRQTEEALQESQAALERSREQLQALTARLFAAQEDERRRLSRELHDDLNQKMAMLAVEVEVLEGQLPRTRGLIRDALERLRRRVIGISDDLSRLAYQLHPSVLEHLGLVVALESYCAEFSKHDGVAVRFLARKLPEHLPEHVALCLYRVVQEALRNLARHSHSTQGTVTLVGTRRGARLSIADNGVGFDPQLTRSKGGLGLLSMEERVRLAGGRLTVKSQPGKGTHIEVRIPLPEAGS